MACHCSSTPLLVDRMHRSGWPLIGRDDVLDTLTAAIARRGTGSIVLDGRPGVGRSRLAHEALQSAQSSGAATEWFVATRAAAPIPFGAFGRLLAGIDVEGSDRLNLFLSAVKALVERAGGRRLILGVDDAHLLDQAGAALLHQLAATGTAFVVATICTGEPAPEPIAALGMDGIGARIELPPLTPADFERLLGTVLDGPMDGRTLHDLVRSSHGSVSFLHELVAAGLESGALAMTDGIWRWTGPLGSHRLLAVVESRLGGPTADERALLELLAAGEPLELALLERLVPGPGLEAVERKGYLTVVQDDRRVSVRLAYPLHGEAIRATTPPLRARALRRHLTSALRERGRRRRSDLLRSAAWRLDSGEAVNARELLAAALQAASCFDHGLAERLSRAAVSSGGGFEADRLLSQALIGQGRLDEAEALLRDLPRPDETKADLGLLTAVRYLTAGRHHEALRAAETTLRPSNVHGPTRLHALGVATMARAAVHLESGNLDEAEVLASTGYRRSLREQNDAARTPWAFLLGQVALNRGRVRTAARWFREGSALSRTVSPLDQLPCCLVSLSIAAAQAGDADTAKAALAEAEEIVRSRNPFSDPNLMLARAWTAAVYGETSRATKLALEAGDTAWAGGRPGLAVCAFHDAARLGAVADALGRMSIVAAAVEGRSAHTMLTHATALEERDGAALDAVSAAFETMGAALLAAEAASEAAAIHRRNGKLTSSLVASDRARGLRSLCEGAKTRALERIECDVLTRREREVAALAARGLSNRDIANRLVVSVRTIENQLHHVYGKLGVAGRQELATALGASRRYPAGSRQLGGP